MRPAHPAGEVWDETGNRRVGRLHSAARGRKTTEDGSARKCCSCRARSETPITKTTVRKRPEWPAVIRSGSRRLILFSAELVAPIWPESRMSSPGPALHALPRTAGFALQDSEDGVWCPQRCVTLASSSQHGRGAKRSGVGSTLKLRAANLKRRDARAHVGNTRPSAPTWSPRRVRRDISSARDRDPRPPVALHPPGTARHTGCWCQHPRAVLDFPETPALPPCS